ncbi:MAG: multicopper oxidase domain-containing protein, partial [Deltaproteobacteria bacterium]|nr:multicopper oxidase domain-containing protein [Deltaproteobacteria bacterium]
MEARTRVRLSLSPQRRLGAVLACRAERLAARARLLATLLTLAACQRSPEMREFAGSYPSATAPTGVVREFALTAAPTELPLLDGRRLAVWAYNGQVPGPTLRVRLGETVRVTFTNRLPQPTTIHWHGVRVPNRMDGVPGVTQPPIAPGESFVYEFTPPDAGTFWFHPHLRASEQVERGLFGVLIVEDAEPPPYSRDLVWVLDDWLIDRDGTIAAAFNTRHDLAHDGRWGNVVTVNGQVAPTLALRPGERIRLRLLNVANGRIFKPDFGALGAKAIAVDGLYAARPIDANGVELAPGNRLDVDLIAPAAGESLAVTDRCTRQPITLGHIAVDGAPMAPQTFASPARAHVPHWSQTLSQTPLRWSVALNARAGGPFGIEWTLNGEVMTHDHHTAMHPALQLPRGEFSRVRF